MNRTSARRVLPSDAQCVPRWVDSPDFERHGPYVVCATRRPPVTWALVSALVSSPSVCLDGSTVWTLDAVLPWTVPMRAVSSRQMPSVCLDGLTVRILSAMDRTSAHRLRRLRHPPPTGHLGACVCACVLPSDAQCVPRWVDSPDFGGPVSNSDPGAIDVADDIRLDCRLVHIYSINESIRLCLDGSTVLTRTLGAIDVLGNTRLDCCLVHIYSINESIRLYLDGPTVRTLDAVLPWTVPLRAVSSRQMPSVCLDGLTVRTLSAVLPWTVPLRLGYVGCATRRPPVTWVLGSALVSSRQMPSVCLDGSTVWTLDAVLPWTVPIRAVSSRQMPSVCLDGLTVRILSAMDRTSAHRLRRLRHPPPTSHLGACVCACVLPSDAQCVPRWVDSLDVGCRVAMDRTYARRVLPSDAQCVPRWVDSPDFGGPVSNSDPGAIDVADDIRLDCRLVHIYSINESIRLCLDGSTVLTRTLGAIDVLDNTRLDCCLSGLWMPCCHGPYLCACVLPSDAQCVPRWVDSPDFKCRVAMDRTSAPRLRRLRHPPPTSHLVLGSALVSSRQMPSVCLDGSTVRILDAVLPWTVPLRAVSSRQMPTPWTVPLRIGYVVCATRRPPVTWALVSALVSSRQMPSVPRWVDSLDVGCRVAMDRTYARRVLPSDAQVTQCVPRWVDSLDVGCRVAMDRTYARRVLPSDAHYVVCATRRPPATWALVSALVSSPSDAQCVPRWVDGPDFGRRVAMDCTSARRVLPSDAQCVPRWVDSPDFGGPVSNSDPGAIDVADDTQLDCRLVHIYSINESIRLCLDGSTVLTRTLGAIDVLDNTRLDCCLSGLWMPCCHGPYLCACVLPSDAQCVPRWVDSPDFKRRVAMDRTSAPRLRRLRHPPPTSHLVLGSALVSSRQMPSVCLDGSTVRILDAVLPWTVPLRAVSSRQMPNRGTASGVQQQYLTHIYVRHESSDAEGHLADLATTLNGVFNGYAPTYNKSPESTMSSLKKEDEADPSASIKSFRTGPFLTLQSLSARYLTRRDDKLFHTVCEYIKPLYLGRRQLLAQTLNAEETINMRRDYVTCLISGNIVRGLDVVFRLRPGTLW
ncbi:hypothetical protein B0H14DRAFT_3517620 [Mycena olivaceomarginata]|nr:hypothetical protein B0H14DRAFT_3517620 [Mycena olivaceomarginata]